MDYPIEITSRKAGPIPLLPALPTLYMPQTISGAGRLEAKGPFGHLSLQEIAGEGYTVWHQHYLLYNDDTLTFAWNRPAPRLWLSLKNSFYYVTGDQPEQALHERAFNIDYAPVLQQTVRLQGKQAYSCIAFHFSPSFFEQWAAHFVNVEDFLHRVKTQQLARFRKHNAVAGRDLLLLIDDILYCTYTAAIRRRYLTHKVMEALLLSLQQLNQAPAGSPVQLSDTVVTGIYRAAALATENLARKYSIRELSDSTGLSTYNLKKGFKAIFNLTVMDYLHEARMQKARLLLEETDLPIPLIASRTGYLHPFAFSSAFRKFFGYPPSLVRKSKRTHTD